MKLIKEIYRSDFDSSFTPSPDQKYKVRKASRAILLKDGKIAILDVTKQGIHKIPGGGMEAGEDVREALKREILEEAGCQAEIVEELGITIEYRDEFEQIQISYIYIANVVGEPKEVSFTQDESEDGFQLHWVELNKVLAIMENDKPEDVADNKYISLRDKLIVKYYLHTLKHPSME